MRQPVIIDAIRTPIGKKNGAFRETLPASLLGHVQKRILQRSGIEPDAVGQVVGGCVTQVGEQAFNVTRTAWLYAGLPYSVAATTVDCQCGSSQQANHMVDNMIRSRVIDVGIACGVEVMTRIPMGANTTIGFGRARPDDFPYDMPNQFVAAERIAKKHGVTRQQADRLGLTSQQRAAAAARSGRLQEEIEPVEVTIPQSVGAAASRHLVTADEGIRATSAEALARLRPVLDDGIHTAGNTSQISDGAAAVLWMEQACAQRRGLRPRARIFSQVLVGTDPCFHIEGPIDATRALLKASGLSLRTIDRFEINEAFASVVLAWRQTFDIDDAQLNVNGGAIALGHPMGASGARLITTALCELERSDREFALIAMCCGGAVATGTILQRC